MNANSNLERLALKSKIHYQNWDFNTLRLEDRAHYDKYTVATAHPIDIWSSNFAYLWAHTRVPNKLTIMYSRVKGMLVTWILTLRGRLYLPCLPVGTGSLSDVVDVLSLCVNFCHDWNLQSGFDHKPVVAKMSSNQLAYFQHSNHFNKLFEPKLLSGVERHLSVSRLSALSGKQFSTIRYKLNKFRREYSCAELRLYTASDFDAVVELGEKWKASVSSKHRRILDNFYFTDTIKHHQELGLEQLVVELNDKIIGMTSGGILPTGDAWGYLTKFDTRYEGLSEYLVVAMARRLHEIDENVELINIGTDFGNQKLAIAKEKFRPVKAYQRYALKWKTLN
jgi:hypothetical protein